MERTLAPNNSADDTRRRALSYLNKHHVLTLATSGLQGIWAAAVFYVNSDLNLYFLSGATTRHARNLESNPRAAGTIHEDYFDWRQIKGIQLEGTTSILSGLQKEQAMKSFLKKYAYLDATDGPISAALAEVNWYCLEPERLYFIDNSQGFGHRDEIDIDLESR